jgi:hypothetical protein
LLDALLQFGGAGWIADVGGPQELLDSVDGLLETVHELGDSVGLLIQLSLGVEGGFVPLGAPQAVA